jgi:hypothetical protein
VVLEKILRGLSGYRGLYFIVSCRRECLLEAQVGNEVDFRRDVVGRFVVGAGVSEGVVKRKQFRQIVAGQSGLSMTYLARRRWTAGAERRVIKAFQSFFYGHSGG